MAHADPDFSPDHPAAAVPDAASAASSPGAQDADWARRRRDAAAERARMLQARQAAEHQRAARIVALFIAVAEAEGLEATPLRVRGYGGGSARTPLTGWYLRQDQSVAIDTTGRFYILTRPLSVRDRLLGVTPADEPVPMTIGEGGRDGDIVPLRTALDRLLPGWEERSPEPLA
ncbi:hypothetical protein [Actinomyces glycerinitolerans]|uniref:Uncharacterized protein n=1 Tax=Actinomyces glycerinitolerans TaxID=1892869 RepID=A0A1M4RV94_9ACTO|nr:hypothetical protein [Actinomyces glycerinitolerans]SHE23840.1 Hypothetical protein ACGLYG10_0037 [Actinomyces glycerinitolerans]